MMAERAGVRSVRRAFLRSRGVSIDAMCCSHSAALSSAAGGVARGAEAASSAALPSESGASSEAERLHGADGRSSVPSAQSRAGESGEAGGEGSAEGVGEGSGEGSGEAVSDEVASEAVDEVRASEAVVGVRHAVRRRTARSGEGEVGASGS